VDGKPAVERVDSTVDFHWTFLPPAEPLDKRWYSARWTGALVAPVTGRMQLGVEGNDGFRLYLNEQLVIDAWEKRGFSSRQTSIAAVRGRAYQLRLEFRDRASLAPPGQQEELIRRVAATGRPVVVVLIGGGAVTMTGWLDQVAAVLAFWYPGEAGGEALAALLLGDAAPGGRLPYTVPREVGQLPLVYNHKPTGRGDDFTDLSGEPLFPFGSGLRYTSFAYGELRISRDSIGVRERVEVRRTVRNSGARAGDGVVQLYLRDPVTSVARPVLQLRGARKIRLAPGEGRVVSFLLGPEDFTLLDAALRPVVERGDFEILVGASSKDLRLRGTVTIH
jgi:beta-glucosidase